MANLTLAIDDDLLKQARMKAVAEGTSLNAVVRDILGRYVHGAPQEQVAALDSLFDLAPKPQRQGKRRWQRGDLYDR